jgi:hypothetical protein
MVTHVGMSPVKKSKTKREKSFSLFLKKPCMCIKQKLMKGGATMKIA